MKNKNLISISGKKGSGKDLLGKIFQVLLDKPTAFDKLEKVTEKDIDYAIWDNPRYEIKKFASKLKQMVALVLGCTVEDLEDREFKEKELGEEWWYYVIKLNQHTQLVPYLDTRQELKPETLIKLTPRKFLQLLGTEAGREIIHPNIWINALFADYKESFTSVIGSIHDPISYRERSVGYPNWIITDTRFSNEYKVIKDRGGICIKVEREKSCHVCGTTKYERRGKFCDKIECPQQQDIHASETSLDNHEFDYVINNNGTIEDLVEEAKKFLKKFNYIK